VVTVGNFHSIVFESLVVDRPPSQSSIVPQERTHQCTASKQMLSGSRQYNCKASMRILYYLMEPLRGTQGENDGKDKLIEKFREHAEGWRRQMSSERFFDEELAELEPASNVTINHFDWLTQVLGIFPSHLNDSMSISFPRFPSANTLLRTTPSRMLDKFSTKITTNWFLAVGYVVLYKARWASRKVFLGCLG